VGNLNDCEKRHAPGDALRRCGVAPPAQVARACVAIALRTAPEFTQAEAMARPEDAE